MNNAFGNYTEFINLFGMCEHGNGEKSRRNKILLSLYKSKEILHYMATHTEESEGFVNYYGCDNMTSLYTSVMAWLYQESTKNDNAMNYMHINSDQFYSVKYKLDDFQGICEDGDIRSIRYINTERDRVFKMKAGKFLRNIIEENQNLNRILPEQIKIWVCEEFAERWKAFASEKIAKDQYTLYVDDEFESIYNSENLKGDFHSCMTDEGYYTFYENSVSAKAAYLMDEDDMIVARCIIYTDVIDDNGNHLRLAERQYSTDCDDSLKRLLVMRLIEGNHIDGYKKVGADCHSPKAFVDIHGNTLSNLDLHIECDLYNYDVVSYQDSFKYYDDDKMIAYNDGDYENLSVTNGEIDYGDEDENHDYERWSDYNDCWIDEEDAIFIESRNDWFYSHQTRYAYYQGSNGRWYQSDYFEEDCIEINDGYYYAGDDCDDWYDCGIRRCERCGEYFVPERENAEYSSLTGEWYCDDDCKEIAENEYIEENDCREDCFDGEWYDIDKESDVRVLVWDYQDHCRHNGYTKRSNLYRSNFVNYKGNWYLNNVDTQNRMPMEKMQRDMFAA